jgi:signal peptidase II
VKDNRKIVSFLVIVAAVWLVDRAGKFLALEHLADGLSRSYLADLLRLEYMKNTGAILGLGSQLPEDVRRWMMPLSTFLILIWVSVMLVRENGFGWAAAGFALVWGGGFANLVDRVASGEVVDFFNIGIGSLRTGTSNLADVAIMAGIPMIALGWLRAQSAPGGAEDGGSFPDPHRLAI